MQIAHDVFSAELPAGWTATGSRPTTEHTAVLRLASFEMPLGDDDNGFAAQQKMSEDDVLIIVADYREPGPWMRSRAWQPPDGRPAISRSDFQDLHSFSAPETAKRLMLLNDRAVTVRVAFGTPVPSDDVLARTNEVLAGTMVEPAHAGDAARDLSAAVIRSQG